MAQCTAMKILSLVIITLLLPLTALAEEVTGPATVIDGRTIEIQGQQIRLFGLDVPDRDQPCYTPKEQIPNRCGLTATEKFKRMVREQTLRCEGDQRDEEGRLIAICYSALIEVNEQMVLLGLAMVDPAQGDRYQRMEVVAKKLKDGLWRNQFIPPWEWRKGRHLPNYDLPE